MPTSDTLHATCASGLQGVLRDELISMGLQGVDSRGAGAAFTGGLEAGYRACLHSRVANRILLPLHSGAAPTPEALYDLVRELDWSEHLEADGSLAVDFYSANSGITHTQYGALKVKDAIVDQFREATGGRPDVDRDTPDVRINVYVFRDKARLALDLSGASLHRRGYRGDGGLAPLKENVAAALLLASGWPAAAEAGRPFVDPMCGSGTLLVEAATIAARRAPGIGRRYWGFTGWKGHEAPLWDRLNDEALAAVREVAQPMRGLDRDARAVAAAEASLRDAGVRGDIAVHRADVYEARALSEPAPGEPAPGERAGFLISNPPWGERLAATPADYATLGRSLSRAYPGWRCALFTSVTAPMAALGLPLAPALEVMNGGIECRLSVGDIPALRRKAMESGASAAAGANGSAGTDAGTHAVSGANNSANSNANGNVNSSGVDATPAMNRLAKNRRSLKGFLRQQGVRAYRVYDADLPEFAIAVDVFDCGEAGDERHVVVQEYEPPRSVNQALAADRLDAFVAALPAALNVPTTRLHLKTRTRQRGDEQYRRRDAGAGAHGESPDAVRAVLHENGAAFTLNFSDYLDVGLFLDHRPLRRHVAGTASGRRVLNLFSYTGSLSVAAALGGARASVSVDLSNRYVAWAERNLALNGADAAAHTVVRADVLEWLARADEPPFDLILLDPPTHSNSSATERDWNVQDDHAAAIDACMRRLAPGGQLVFSNNFRRFKLDPRLEPGTEAGPDATSGARYRVEDRTAWSIDPDFRRRAYIHRCWFISHAGNAHAHPIDRATA